MHKPTEESLLMTTIGAGLPNTTDSGGASVPVIGLPGQNFYVIHVTAHVCMLITIATSVAILYVFFRNLRAASGGAPDVKAGSVNERRDRGDVYTVGVKPVQLVRWKHHVEEDDDGLRAARRSTDFVWKRKKSFWKCPLAQRLVVYLACADLVLAMFHSTDHAYMLITRDHPPDRVCAAFGAVLQWLTLAQWAVVLFTAISATCLIVLEYRVKTGRHDVVIFLGCYVLPLSLSAVTFALNMNGPSGAWCNACGSSDRGKLLTFITSILVAVVIAVLLFCYGSIIIKIIITSRNSGMGVKRYAKSIKVMVVFALAFILQWWPMIALSFLPSLGNIIPMIIVTIMFTNLGGVFNGIAYTVLRKYIQ